MQAPHKAEDPIADLLRLVAKAETARTPTPMPPRLNQWLQDELSPQPSRWQTLWQRLWHSWFGFLFVTSAELSTNRRLGLRMGMAGALGGALLGAGAISLIRRRSEPVQDGSPEWVRVIEQYQSLYVRATLPVAVQSPQQAQSVSRAFTSEAQLPHLAIPDLSALGLIFQRAQQLSFKQVPLLQLVYLAAQGLPLALCVMPAKSLNDHLDDQVNISTAHGLSSTYWRQKDLALVLVADWAAPRLSLLQDLVRKKIANTNNQ